MLPQTEVRWRVGQRWNHKLWFFRPLYYIVIAIFILNIIKFLWTQILFIKIKLKNDFKILNLICSKENGNNLRIDLIQKNRGIKLEVKYTVGLLTPNKTKIFKNHLKIRLHQPWNSAFLVIHWNFSVENSSLQKPSTFKGIIHKWRQLCDTRYEGPSKAVMTDGKGGPKISKFEWRHLRMIPNLYYNCTRKPDKQYIAWFSYTLQKLDLSKPSWSRKYQTSLYPDNPINYKYNEWLWKLHSYARE